MSWIGTIRETNFELGALSRGKVRDNYDLGNGELLMVATDRISASDVILPNAIPSKGKILTMLTVFWLGYLRDIVRNHLITSDFEQFPEVCRKYPSLEGRSLLVKKLKPLQVELIVRGYLSGSGWKEYQKNQSVCGIKLPDGLKESDRLPEVIFTPSTKAEAGEHDINLSFEEYVKVLENRLGSNLGKRVAFLLRTISVQLYIKAAEYALTRRIIIADTKLEFAVDENDNPVLIDEVLTPDSSRFWPKDEYEPGRPQKSFDKQFVRDYLERIGWDKKPPAPELPEYIVEETQKKYGEILKLI
ncbi:MAG: Phosphoribosylaminoimidazole-succinocarboxamide synthase [Parcubacteria group bacterium GW2011_GWA1_40_21]|nr:MAG: Phosphoribosylaminoimidazole-succinocarboxamide synthase [Parcubacteria group bacterium GW2011_GWA1_40_21]